ncbi:hypothetical protein GE061_000317 [Apolygus lucorum]|uniref:Transposase Helix-turn-helix domain-containing protein n=1 Tax=Apolygus lucorum TaxID=248454 RepID=A0A8S9Y3X8_APOLU|nr:hypothetical protein GE061_000317 [Apolygus lucorum]
MSKETFHYILSLIEGKLDGKYSYHSFHLSPISPKEKLVITLRYLATGCSFRALAFSFRMVASTVLNIYEIESPVRLVGVFRAVGRCDRGGRRSEKVGASQRFASLPNNSNFLPEPLSKYKFHTVLSKTLISQVLFPRPGSRGKGFSVALPWWALARYDSDGPLVFENK